ncbi:hypothetical protein HK097_009603 [Rhizophlyctis rosea]|uniref:Cytochrome b5 heme-binding domain-containing protein n=1 Tax=Rhizophlyctis rosea TaxID=64517 RepID=A0AAD5SIL2_9FUNG|nr:hypothetical protein HK097_009603 [Rhizophlyctis rosea]
MPSGRASTLYHLAVSILLSILLTTSSAHSLHPRQAITEVPLEQPDIAGFDFHKTLHSSAKYNIQLHWTVQAPSSPINTGARDQLRAPPNTYLLHVALQLEGLAAPTADTRPWVALGIGQSMLDTEFVICRQAEGAITGNSTAGKVTIEERFAPKKYAPPIMNTANRLITPLRGIRLPTSLLCEFTREANHTSDNHVTINPKVYTPILWAYGGLMPSPSRPAQFFSYHGPGSRGANETIFLTGTVISAQTKSFQKKVIHGAGMMASWLFLFPFGVFYARYFRSKPGWMYVHACTQVLGLMTIFMVLGVIASDNITPNKSIHPAAGLLLVSLILIQVLFGIASLVGLWNEGVARLRGWIKMFHNNVGFMLMLVAGVTAGLGVETLYPFSQGGVRMMWYPYIVLVIFWPIVFITAEVYYRKSVVRKEPRRGVRPMMPGKKIDGGSTGGGLDRGGSLSGARNRKEGMQMTELPIHAERKVHMKMYTWETLDEAVSGGEMLVVGNGHYIYDISKWITSHPGGQLILHAVNGTDITNDYFHEAGFDADDFAPRAPIPANISNRNGGKLPRQATVSSRASTTMSARVSVYGAVAALAEEKSNSLIDEKEWKLLLKSRRTHVHTRLAIQRLSHLLVGELVRDSNQPRLGDDDTESPASTPSSSSTLVPPGHRFDVHEYRRYALIDKEQVTAPSSANPHQHPVYRFKFCLLYPYDRRESEPPKFLPGQCVEIQARIKEQMVSRFYTVLSDGGTTTTFELLVKVYPEGVMGQFLAKQKPGDKQIKIRGPFGTPLVPIPRGVSMAGPNGPGRRGVGTIYFFAGGSGVTPFLQLVKNLLLPVMEPLIITTDYHPSQPDELPLVHGDRLVATHHYHDGWAIGHNLRTQQQGAFPLSCTLPPSGPHTNLVLINSVHTMEDIFGTNILEGAMLAYPGNIEVHHFVANGYRTGAAVREGVSGCVYEGRVKTGDVMQIVGRRWWRGSEEGGADQKIIVCGPGRFEGDMMDALGECGVELDLVEVLPPDRFV